MKNPFGMLVPNRNASFDNSDYRYGFQGQERDDELKGSGNSINYTFRMHDPRVGRFFSVDPLAKKYPFLSPYQFSSNQPLHSVELEGLESANHLSPEKEAVSNVFMGFFFPPAPKFKREPWRSPGSVGGAMARKTLATNVAMSGAVAGGYFAAPVIQASYASYTNWYIYSNFSSTLATTISNGFTFNGILNTSMSTGVALGGSNLLGQFVTNDFRLDEKINYAQPVFAATIRMPLTSNFFQSGISFDTKNGWDVDFTSQDFLASFTSNLISDKFSAGLGKFNFSGNSKASNFMFKFYSGIGAEIGGNLIENQFQASNTDKETGAKSRYPWGSKNNKKENKEGVNFLSKFKGKK